MTALKPGLCCCECGLLLREAVQTEEGERLCRSCYEKIQTTGTSCSGISLARGVRVRNLSLFFWCIKEASFILIILNYHFSATQTVQSAEKLGSCVCAVLTMVPVACGQERSRICRYNICSVPIQISSSLVSPICHSWCTGALTHILHGCVNDPPTYNFF